MLTTAIWIALALFGAAMLLNLYRIVRGPTPMDRVLAIDTTYVNAVALIVILGIVLDTRVLFEVAVLVAMVGFVSTVAFSRYLLRGNILE